MDQSLRAIIWLKQRLAQRCSINVGFFVLSFVPSFIYSLSHSLIHLFTHSVRGVRDTSTILTSGVILMWQILVLLKDFGLQFCTGSLLGALRCLGRNPPVPSLSAGVEEVMSTQSEPPDTGDIQVQAAYDTAERLNSVPDLEKQGARTPGSWALSRTPSLPTATQSSRGPSDSFAPACGALNWMLRGPRLRAGRGVSTVPTRCQWSEAALGGSTEVQPPVSLQETSLDGGARGPGRTQSADVSLGDSFIPSPRAPVSLPMTRR